ncbi:hypothetical protein M9H77_18197 [Catharanthus roseus]|uniref:Uncharacterized protein n=1 Tax=Catharanthus roseus TaxID=4058 RepID=A0ACC0B6R7_CATRO|nr:hypothetical protein M9H77_18197 [Catharanthus roseus]
MTFPELLSLLQLLLLCFAQSTNSSLELKILSVVNKYPRLIYSSSSKNSSNHCTPDGQKFRATFVHLDESSKELSSRWAKVALKFLPIWAKVLLKLKKINFLTSKSTFSCSNSSGDSIH